MASSKVYRVVKGQTWVRAVYTELHSSDVPPVVTPLPLTTPAMLEIRAGADPESDLIFRFDSDPTADEGLIEEDGLERGGLILSATKAQLEALDLSPSGGWPYDMWARLATAPTLPILVLRGKFCLTDRVTDDIVDDA